MNCEQGKEMDINGSTRVTVKRTGHRTEFTYYTDEKRIAAEIFESGRMIRREGTIPDGPVVECYPDGAVKRVVSYRDQRYHGQSLTYYHSGELLEEQYFRNGKLDGPCVRYRRDGILWTESSYLSGRLHGAFRTYHDNGQIEAAGCYEKGKLCGDYEYYDRYGCLREKGEFRNGKRAGTWTSYSESGEVAQTCAYRTDTISAFAREPDV